MLSLLLAKAQPLLLLSLHSSEDKSNSQMSLDLSSDPISERININLLNVLSTGILNKTNLISQTQTCY